MRGGKIRRRAIRGPVGPGAGRQETTQRFIMTTVQALRPAPAAACPRKPGHAAETRARGTQIAPFRDGAQTARLTGQLPTISAGRRALFWPIHQVTSVPANMAIHGTIASVPGYLCGQASSRNARTCRGAGEDEGVPGVSFGDVAMPDRDKVCCCQPVQVGGSVGVVPEHVGPEIVLNACPLLGSHDGRKYLPGRSQSRIRGNKARWSATGTWINA